MNLNLRKTFLIVCAVFASGIMSAQSIVDKPMAGPTVFSEEDDQFKNSVPIPKNVLDVVHENLNTDSMKYVLEHLERNEFAQLFRAVVVHLRGPKETDYVLLSEYPLGGADAPWFWIVRVNQDRPKVIFVALANSIELLKSSKNEYPNIRSYGYTAGGTYTSIYHYDGQRYILAHEYHKEQK